MPVLASRWRRLLATTCALLALAGCAGEPDATGKVTGSGAAVDACLSAAATHSSLAVDEATTTDVSVGRDEQGWWAVVATLAIAGTTQVVTCTAVPERGGHGVRAASWSVRQR